MNPSKDAGTILALLDRLNNYRMPRALELKTRVERGEKLTELDKAFLKRVVEESKDLEPLISRNPQYGALMSKMTALYNDITNKGLENERKN